MSDLICERRRVEVVADALASAADTVHPIGTNCWKLGFDADPSKQTVVRCDEDWCLFECPIGSKRLGVARARQLLHQNADLPGMLSYGADPRTAKPILGTEILLESVDSSSDEPCAVSRACASIRGVLLADAPDGVAIRDDRTRSSWLASPLRADDELGEAVLSLGKITRWPLHERGNGEVAVTLKVPDSFCQAQLFRAGDAGLRISVLLDTPPKLPKRCSQAISMFLLTATRLVCMARAVAVGTGPSTEYGWEVVWPEMPNAIQFDSGLTALSVACRITANELQAICDESLAAEYLKVRGWSLREGCSSK